MPITTPASYADKLDDLEHFPHVLTHLFAPALMSAGLKLIPPTATGAEMIHAEIIKNLVNADFVLCDLSGLNANVVFELGVRTSLDRPVILVKDDLTDKTPFDISSINIATYDSALTPWSLDIEVPKLAEHIKEVVAVGDARNSMWKYFGLTRRAAPPAAGGNPVEAKLDLLLAEMMKLQSTRPHAVPPQEGQVEEISILRQKRGETSRVAEIIRPVLSECGVREFIIRTTTSHGRSGYVVSISKGAEAETSSLVRRVSDRLRSLGYSPADFLFQLEPEVLR
jgi:nucleoside 2-deoxyribosyltransferase